MIKKTGHLKKNRDTQRKYGTVPFKTGRLVSLLIECKNLEIYPISSLVKQSYLVASQLVKQRFHKILFSSHYFFHAYFHTIVCNNATVPLILASHWCNISTTAGIFKSGFGPEVSRSTRVDCGRNSLPILQDPDQARSLLYKSRSQSGQ